MQLFGKQLNLLVEFLSLAFLVIENLLRSVQIVQGGGENLRVVYDQLVVHGEKCTLNKFLLDWRRGAACRSVEVCAADPSHLCGTVYLAGKH